MADYISTNTPVSEPPLDTPEVHADFVGLAFNLDAGIFVPRETYELLNELPYLEPIDARY